MALARAHNIAPALRRPVKLQAIIPAAVPVCGSLDVHRAATIVAPAQGVFATEVKGRQVKRRFIRLQLGNVPGVALAVCVFPDLVPVHAGLGFQVVRRMVKRGDFIHAITGKLPDNGSVQPQQASVWFHPKSGVLSFCAVNEALKGLPLEVSRKVLADFHGLFSAENLLAPLRADAQKNGSFFHAHFFSSHGSFGSGIQTRTASGFSLAYCKDVATAQWAPAWAIRTRPQQSPSSSFGGSSAV